LILPEHLAGRVCLTREEVMVVLTNEDVTEVDRVRTRFDGVVDDNDGGGRRLTEERLSSAI